MRLTRTEKEFYRRLRDQPRERKPSNADVRRSAEDKELPRTGSGFKDIAGMQELKTLMTESFINVLRHRKKAEMYGIKPPSCLLWGPSGCGKSFFIEKLGDEVGLPLIRINPDDLASPYVHGTQEKIAKVFQEAEAKAPVILFFDEFEAMVPVRSDNESNLFFNAEVDEFLCMLNNASDRGIYIMAATNHPERIDRSVLRTGRIDEMIYIDMPDVEARKSLFLNALSKLPKDVNIDIDRLAALTAGYNCSDICYIVKTAARMMFNRSIEHGEDRCFPIGQDVLEEAILKRRPSVSTKDLRQFERIREELMPGCKAGRKRNIGYV